MATSEKGEILNEERRREAEIFDWIEAEEAGRDLGKVTVRRWR